MQLDCHYYGTYYMAYLAGFTPFEARQIAWAAQTVDEMNYDTVRTLVNNQIENKLAALDYGVLDKVLSPFEYNEKKDKIVKETRNKYPLVTVESVSENANDLSNYTSIYRSNENKRKIVEMVRGVWCPFHFLPGDFYELNKLIYNNEQKISQSDYQRWYEDMHLLCQNSTQMCRDMINKARTEYRHYKKGSLSDKNRALYAVGICMHVLADTWTHQDFCGSFNQLVNQGDMSEGEYDTGRFVIGGFGWIFIPSDTPVWTGHGSVGTNPDIPGIKFSYSTNYGKNIFVDNPTRFRSAFLQMYDAMVYIKSEKPSTFEFRNFDISNNPDYQKNPIIKEIYELGKVVFTSDYEAEKRCSLWKEYLLGKCDKLHDYSLCCEDTEQFQLAAKEHRDYILDLVYRRNLHTYYSEKKLDKLIANELYAVKKYWL